MATVLTDSDGDRLVESRRPLDELDVELTDLGGDCIKVMQLLRSDSSLLKDRALPVLHLGVSRGCIEIVEQVVKFYEGEDGLGDRSEPGLEKDEQQTTRATEDGSKASSGDKGEDVLGERSELDQQGVKSREEEINDSSDNTDAPTVSFDELEAQIDEKNENNDPDASHSQDDCIQGTAAGKGTIRRTFLDFVDVLVRKYGENVEIEEVLGFSELLLAKYLYSGPGRELDALEVAVVNGNLDILDLLLTKTPSASRTRSRIGPKTRSVAVRELHRKQLREITKRVVERISGHPDSFKICHTVLDAWRDDPDFNFLFWDFGLGEERDSEYLLHFLFTNRNWTGPGLDLAMYLWGQVWNYPLGEPWEEPLWMSLLKLHDAQGRTPLHVAVDEDTVGNFKLMLDELRLGDRVEVFAFAMEATDGLGRTPWHRALLRLNNTDSALMRWHEDLAAICRLEAVDAPGIYDRKKNEVSYVRFWQHPMEDPISRLESRGILGLSWPDPAFEDRFKQVSGRTPLHSQLLQVRITSWSRLKATSYGMVTFSPQDTLFRWWMKEYGTCYIDALELATLTSNVDEVKRLLSFAERSHLKSAYTRNLNSKWGQNNRYGWVVGDKKEDYEDFKYLPCPTIHIAAYSGNYEMLKVFIASKICDTYIEDGKGCTIFHALLDPRKFKMESELFD